MGLPSIQNNLHRGTSEAVYRFAEFLGLQVEGLDRFAVEDAITHYLRSIAEAERKKAAIEYNRYVRGLSRERWYG